MNRHAAAGRLNDRISRECFGNKERPRLTKSNNSFDRSASQLAFHSRGSDAWLVECAPGQFGR
jgi:hypothetical protein